MGDVNSVPKLKYHWLDIHQLNKLNLRLFSRFYAFIIKLNVSVLQKLLLEFGQPSRPLMGIFRPIKLALLNEITSHVTYIIWEWVTKGG